MSRPKSVLEAAESGTYHDLLVALRDRIATRIDEGVSARDLVGLSRRLIDLAAAARDEDHDAERPRLAVVEDGPFDPEAV